MEYPAGLKATWTPSTLILSLTLRQWLKGDNERESGFTGKKKLKEEPNDKRILFLLL